MSQGEGDRLQLNRQGLAVIALAALVLTSGLAVATHLSNSVPVGGTIPVGTQSGMDVYVTDHGGKIVLKDPWINSTALDVRTENGNATVVAQSSGDGKLNLTQITGTETQITGIDTSAAAVKVNPEDKAAIVINGGVTAVDYHANGDVAVGDGNTDFEYAASATGSVEIGGLPANTQLEGVTGNGKKIQTFTTDGSGRATISLPSTSKTSVKIIDAGEPKITSASPKDGAQVPSTKTTLEATVEDPDFADSNGDTVSVTFYLNGNQVKQSDITSNQTVSADVEPPLGQNSTWNVTVEDGYSQTNKIADRTFETPATLKIYNESRPAQLLDNSSLNLTVRFFALSNTSDEVVERQAQNGKVNLTNLPADERFVVTVDAENYSYRRIVIDSLYETNKIYLLKESEPSSRVVFELEDPTGTFPPDQTILYIEKPITKDYDGDNTNETRYQTIAGDSFGASARFPAVLRDDNRYRLRVKRADGSSSRTLGFYSVYADTIEPLKIQRIQPSDGQNRTGVVYGGLEGSGNQTELAVRFRGGDSDVSVTYNVTNESGVVVPNTTTTGSFAAIYDVDPGEYTVNYVIEYPDGTTVSGQFRAGGINGVVDRINIDPQVASITSWLMILASMGLVVIIRPRLAPAVGVGTASALVIIGTVAIPGPMLGVGGAIAVLALFGGNQ